MHEITSARRFRERNPNDEALLILALRTTEKKHHPSQISEPFHIQGALSRPQARWASQVACSACPDPR